MKILYIHHVGTNDGSCRSLRIVLPYLIQKGVETHIVSPPGPANDFFQKIAHRVTTLHPHCFPLSMTIAGTNNNRFRFFRSFARPQKLGQIKSIIRESNADIVHCNELGLTSIAKIAKRMNKKVVMHARTMPHKGFPRINRWVEKQINKYCDHVICITGSVENALRSIASKSIVYNPIENLPEPRTRESGAPVTFLSLSAIQENKGVFEVLEAAKLLEQHAHIKFKVAGKLDPPDPSKLSLKHKLLAKVGLLDITTKSRFLKLVETYQLKNLALLGHVSDIEAEIAQCDVMLAPMHLNAPPRSVYEAGIHGLPSILAMEDKVEDVVEHGVNGFLIDQKNLEQLADAILRLANDAELRDRLGNAARARCLEHHDPQVCANRIYSIYERVLTGKAENK